MYAQYLKEREDLDTLETEKGFATYRFRANDCYIQDIYVLPEYRKQGYGAVIADEIVDKAKAEGYKILTGSVDSRANGAAASTQALEAYGMKPYSVEGSLTYFYKELL